MCVVYWPDAATAFYDFYLPKNSVYCLREFLREYSWFASPRLLFRYSRTRSLMQEKDQHTPAPASYIKRQKRDIFFQA